MRPSFITHYPSFALISDICIVLTRLVIELFSNQSPHHSNNDVADGEGCDPGPDVGGEGFFFAVKEGEKQDDEYEGELHADLGVIG